MRIEQSRWTEREGWRPSAPGGLDDAHLALVFGGREAFSRPERWAELRSAYPQARLLGCSTAGEICGTEVTDDAIVSTAVRFDRSRVSAASVRVDSSHDSCDAGRRLAASLERDGLAHVFVLSDGLGVNGSDLVRGLAEGLPAGVTVTGGLAGDGARFQETLVACDGPPERNRIAAIGLHGEALRIGFGSLGGWDPFGTEREITRSTGNVLYELDGTSALELYKRYLGEHASGLPSTGLLFPLSMRSEAGAPPVVRTILAVNESEGSMTFAGDVPKGAYVRLMKANFDRLIDGAAGAARTSHSISGAGAPDLAILVSCVGRKLVLKQRIEEEVEGVREVLGDAAVLTGFYSYGEISPFTPSARCELHNQTMTITTLSER